MKRFKELIKKPLERSIQLRGEQIDVENRTLEINVSSEVIVDRGWWKEILDHSEKSVDLSRFNDGAAVLMDHDRTSQIGVIEKAWLTKEKKLRVILRFSKSAHASEVFDDIADGIRRNVSIGYNINSYVLESEENKVETYRIKEWEPLELSIVSIPADPTVGVGRNTDETDKPDKPKASERTEGSETSESKNKKEVENKTFENKKVEVRTVEPTEKKEKTPDEIRAEERKRVDEIISLAKRHNQSPDEAIRDGLTVEQFKGWLLERISNDKPLETSDADLDMERKDVERYSFMKALRYQMGEISADEAGLEIEASREIAKKLNAQPRGLYIPLDVQNRAFNKTAKRFVQQRDLTAGTDADGGYLVSTINDANSFIDLLRNKMLAFQLGVKRLSGLKGNVAIPKLAAAATAYWVAEGSAPTESQQTFGQIVLSPKTVGAVTELSRQLIMQSDPSAEALVIDDLAKILALGIDLAVFEGSGASNQPTGIASTSGIGSVTGTSFDLAAAIEFETDVATANADVNDMHYITTPAVRGLLKARAIESGDAKRLVENNEMNGYPLHVTNQLTAASMLFGDFSQALVAEWGILDIFVNKSGTNARAGNIEVIALDSVDVGVRQPGAYSRATSIT